MSCDDTEAHRHTENVHVKLEKKTSFDAQAEEGLGLPEIRSGREAPPLEISEETRLPTP